MREFGGGGSGGGDGKKESTTIDVLVATIDLSNALDLRWINYDYGEEGKMVWPFQIETSEDELCVLPNGQKVKRTHMLTPQEWEENTEAIDMEYLIQFKCDVVLFSVGVEGITEVAVYNADRIGSIHWKADVEEYERGVAKTAGNRQEIVHVLPEQEKTPSRRCDVQ